MHMEQFRRIQLYYEYMLIVENEPVHKKLKNAKEDTPNVTFASSLIPQMMLFQPATMIKFPTVSPIESPYIIKMQELPNLAALLVVRQFIWRPTKDWKQNKISSSEQSIIRLVDLLQLNVNFWLYFLLSICNMQTNRQK